MRVYYKYNKFKNSYIKYQYQILQQYCKLLNCIN